MELEELSRFNSWWTTGLVREAVLEKYKRKLYDELKKNLGRRQALLVWGMRRVGKTVLALQLIDDLLKGGVNPRFIVYFSFDEAPSDVRDVLETYQKLVLNTTFEAIDGTIYVFLDEIQKVQDWESKIKVYYDLYPRVKFVLTGSAAVALRKRSRESLAGRIVAFLLEPLSFEEFLELSGKEVGAVRKNPGLWDREMTGLLYRYMRCGSFPELVGEDDEEFARNYVLGNVIERVVYRDVPQEFGLRDVELLRSLLYLVARNPGAVVNYRELSKNLGRDQRTISNYMEYLEYGLLVRLVHNYRGSPLASARKMKKAYLGTPNLAFAFGQPDSHVAPKLLENLVLVKTDAKFFYRNNFEVDFVLVHEGNLIGIEVKEDESDIRQLKLFLKHFPGKVVKAVLVAAGRETIEGVEVVPAWEFLLGSRDFVRRLG
ncbi:MAG: ATP-binding protein [Nitrososphaerota archaeon]|nr:ATP-binding protein [Nitrososphaerota archaeon]MDG6939372.1 ATP-binding protein [Nitrososphaerota archaeon]